MTAAFPETAVPQPGQPVVLRNATVLTMDDARTILTGADVLVSGERIAAVGPNLTAPDGTAGIDAAGGIVLPGMVDTHLHMWQTAMRGYGADWTLTQYFVYYYLTWGKKFRPQDVYAGNLLSAIESVDAGVTTTVDWSHGLQTIDHAEAATDALEEVPGRFVLAYGNIQQGSWEWSTTPEFRDFYARRFYGQGDMQGFGIAFDIPGDDPAFPEKATFEVAREMGVPVTTHAGVYGICLDAGVRRMYENGFCTPQTVYVHSASLSPDSYHMIAATGGSVSVSTESECSAGQGYPPTWKLRKYGIPVSLSQDTSVWWSGAKAIGLDSVIGSVEEGKKADLVLIKNDDSPVSFPILHPYGHVVFQAQRGDVHTVVVNGQVVKFDHRLVDADLAKARRAIDETTEYLRGELGEKAWAEGMNPEVPEHEQLANPYTYTGAAAWKEDEE